MFSLLTINAAIQDVRLFARSLYRPLRHTRERLHSLAHQIIKLEPDIICLQEMFHHDLQSNFHALLHHRYPYVVGLGSSGIKYRLDNELLTFSRFPLTRASLHRFRHAALEERLFTSKGFYRMEVHLPAVGTMQLINFHMTAGGLRHHPESPHMEHLRNLQIRQLLETLNGDMPTILAGDLNAGREVSRVNYDALINRGFTDAFQSGGGSGTSWDPANPLVAHYQENHLPPQRIDHVFLDPRAHELLTAGKAEIVLHEHCVTVPGGEQVPVSDHYGVLVHFGTRRIDKD